VRWSISPFFPIKRKNLKSMEDKKLAEIFDEILRVDKEVRYSSKSYNPECYEEIYKKANTTRPIPNSLEVHEALLIMLQIVHSFKYWIDSCNETNKNVIDINDQETDNEFISDDNEKPFWTAPGYLTTLLLQVLYEVNGAHYRINDPDYMWEEELDEILKLPNWSYELDSEITKFLLLPLYYATHHHLFTSHSDDKHSSF
ncbi:MAG TPA: hypothetical protein PKJ75_07100, partial [Methanosarcina vacuolata]|nr:hypothetical protein [Methanosarcina vacuolata]